MKRAVLLVLAAAAVSACVAVTVERRRPRKGPVKEVGYVDYGGGHVRYSAEGWAWAVASRRKTAMKLMSRNCGSELVPEITDEYSRTDADAAYNGEDIDASMKIGEDHFHIERYIHLAYECRPKGGAPLPAVSTTTARGPSLVIPAVYASTSAAIVELSTATPAVELSSAPVVVSTSLFTVPPSSAAIVPSLSSTTAPAPETPR